MNYPRFLSSCLALSLALLQLQPPAVPVQATPQALPQVGYAEILSQTWQHVVVLPGSQEGDTVRVGLIVPLRCHLKGYKLPADPKKVDQVRSMLKILAPDHALLRAKLERDTQGRPTAELFDAEGFSLSDRLIHSGLVEKDP